MASLHSPRIQVRRGTARGIWLTGRRSGFIEDSLEVWAQALGKSPKSVRRYVQQGIIPDGYQTRGGQWRAPFNQKALGKVKQRLRGFARSRSQGHPALDQFDEIFRREKEARFLTFAAAAELAKQRRPLNEKHLTWFREATMVALAEKGNLDRILQEKEYAEIYPSEAVIKEAKDAPKQTALIAAITFALIDFEAEFKKDRNAMLAELANRCFYNRFGKQASFEGGSIKRIKGLPIALIIPYWQIIWGPYPATRKQTAEITNQAVQWPKKYRSRRTFYNYYPSDYVQTMWFSVMKKLEASPHVERSEVEDVFQEMTDPERYAEPRKKHTPKESMSSVEIFTSKW